MEQKGVRVSDLLFQQGYPFSVADQGLGLGGLVGGTPPPGFGLLALFIASTFWIVACFELPV